LDITQVGINRFLKLSSKGYISGITGAAVAHVIADLVAADGRRS